MSETEIIKGVIEKNSKAERLLHKKYERFMYYMALKITKNGMDAEDVVQDSFIKIFRSIASHSTESSLKAWIGQIVWHTALTHYGRYKQERFSIAIEDYLTFERGKYSFEERFLAADQLANSIKILRKNSPAQYTCFRLYYIEGLNHDEISKDLEISESTSKSNCSRALEKLREIIKIQSSVKIPKVTKEDFVSIVKDKPAFDNSMQQLLNLLDQTLNVKYKASA